MFAGIIGVVDSAMDLATNVVQRMNLKDRLKYIDRVRQLKLEFLEENKKPDAGSFTMEELKAHPEKARIDSKCEHLRDQLFIELQTMNAAMSAGVLEGPKE